VKRSVSILPFKLTESAVDPDPAVINTGSEPLADFKVAPSNTRLSLTVMGATSKVVAATFPLMVMDSPVIDPFVLFPNLIEVAPDSEASSAIDFAKIESVESIATSIDPECDIPLALRLIDPDRTVEVPT